MSSILRRVSCASSLLILIATAASAAGAPAASPTTTAPTAKPAAETTAKPTTATIVDAWGDQIDLTREAQSDMLEVLADQMGSADWGPLAIRILEMEGTVLPRMAGATALDLECAKRYRREHPEAAKSEYGAFLETAAGIDWETACLVAQLSDPQVDPQIVDGAIATLQVTLLLPSLLQVVREGRVQQGLADVPELTPEMAEQLPAMVKDGFQRFGCILREALKKVSLLQIFASPESLEEPLQAAAESGVC